MSITAALKVLPGEVVWAVKTAVAAPVTPTACWRWRSRAPTTTRTASSRGGQGDQAEPAGRGRCRRDQVAGQGHDVDL
jgi:hypothetical protein